MHLHDEISRIADMDDISRVDLHGFVLVDLSVVTRDMAFAGVETALGQDVGSRLPGQSVDRAEKKQMTKQERDKYYKELEKRVNKAAAKARKIRGEKDKYLIDEMHGR